MSASEEHELDEQFSSILAAYDEALATGRTADNEFSRTVSELQPQLLEELNGAQACLRLLEQKWPRSGATVRKDLDHESLPELSLFVFNDLARHLARFEIKRKLGQGGFGVVFLAFDSVLRRQVALKLPRPDTYLTPAMQQQFLKEARAAAALKHPHIVAVYDAGQAGPLCYIAEAYCEGPTLSAWLKQRTEPVDLRLAAELIGTLAAAVDYAHSRGIVHRDIKPGNVLLERKPDRTDNGLAAGRDDFEFVPKLTDFGMARLPGTDTSPSISAALGGTAAYMAPEQVEGRTGEIGPATDVYALGITLYELLTGRTPYHGETMVETLHRVTSEEPTSLRRLRSDVPRDLEAICLKCLEKKPRRRYISADALAEDLRCFLAGEPIQARPVGAAGRVVKWIRRRPALAGLLTVTVLATLGLLGGTLWHAARLQTALDVTEGMRIEAEELRDSAKRQQLLAEDRERSVRHYLYAGDMRLAFSAWKNSHVAEMVELLARHRPEPGVEDLRGFVWHYLWRLCHGELQTLVGHSGDVHCVVYSPDGRRLATASEDGTARLWDAETGSELAILKGHQGELNSVAFSPDGKTLATCGDDHTIRLWDIPGGRMQATLVGHTEAVYSVAFSPDGKTLASSGREHTLRLWDTATGKELAALAGHTGGIEAVVFSPDGKLAATASGDQTTILWDLSTRQPRTTLEGHTLKNRTHEHDPFAILAVAFSHDGRTLATAAEDQVVKLWDVATGHEKATLSGHGEIVQCVAFSPDDQTVAAAVKDGSVWLWDTQAGRVRRTIWGHTGRVWYVAYSPDGSTLATAGGDGAVKIWNAEDDRATVIVHGPSGSVRSLSISPSGNDLAAAFYNDRKVVPPEVWIWTVGAAGARRREDWSHKRHALVSHSPDGQQLAIASDNSQIDFFDAGAQRLHATVKFPLPEYRAFATVAWSPDSRTLATVVHRDRRIFLLDAANGRQLAILARQQNRDLPAIVAFSPDGKTLLSGDDFGALTNWNVSDLREQETIQAHPVGIRGLAYAPDGRSLASSSTDRTIKIWDAETLQLRATLQGHAGIVNCVAFFPNGRTLASGSDDGFVRLWDTYTWQELLALEAHPGGVAQLAFSSDGRMLVSGGTSASGSGEVAIWTTAPRSSE